MRFNDKVAIVTGGGDGFGREISKLLAAASALVGVVDIDKRNAEETAEAIDVSSIALQADIRNHGQVPTPITKQLRRLEA